LPAGLGIVALLLAIFVAVGFAVDEGKPEPRPVASVAVIAKRVERVRGVRFKAIPKAVTVSPEKARAEGLADLERAYPAAERKADETLYATLGLIPRGTDLKAINASLFGEQVAGYYDPRTGRLRVVDGPAAANRVVDEITLAHELTHALEDQAFALDSDQAEDPGDAGYAYRALAEGTATAVMLEYASRYFKADEALGGMLSSAFGVTSTTPLPPFIQAGFTWPYLGGKAFVDDLYAKAGRTWRLIDVALKSRPPASTEQVLHPEKWLAVEQPLPVRFDAGLGPEWAKAAEGTFGEWQTSQLLGSPGPAAGWGGDHYELWTRGPQAVVVVRWEWDQGADVELFVEALHDVMPDLPGTAAVERDGRAATLVAGPDAAVVRRVMAAVTA
jgi:hypothetical protein